MDKYSSRWRVSAPRTRGSRYKYEAREKNAEKGGQVVRCGQHAERRNHLCQATVCWRSKARAPSVCGSRSWCSGLGSAATQEAAFGEAGQPIIQCASCISCCEESFCGKAESSEERGGWRRPESS